MKKFLLIVISFSLLFYAVAPVFSLAASAPFRVNSDYAKYEIENLQQFGTFILAYDADHAYSATIHLQSRLNTIRLDTNNGYPRFVFQTTGATLNEPHAYRITICDLNDTDFIYYKTGNFTPTTDPYGWSITVPSIFTNTQTWYAYCLKDFGVATVTISSDIVSVDPFVNWRSLTVSERTVRSPLAKPDSQFGAVFIADHERLHMITTDVGICEYGLASGYLQDSTTQGYTDISIDHCDFYNLPYLTKYNNNIALMYQNRTDSDRTIYHYIFDINTGQYLSSTWVSVEQYQTRRELLNLKNIDDYGYWYSGCFVDQSLTFYDLLPISWSDTIDYSTDLNAIVALLNQVPTLLTSIDSRLSDLNTLLTQNWNWMKSSFYNTITGKWDLTNNKLDQIIAILSDNTITTIPVDESYSGEVDSYVNEEHSLMDNAASGIEDMSQQFNDVDNVFDLFSDGFDLVRQCWAFVFDGPPGYIVLISAIFGVVLTVIGKRMVPGE